MRAVLMIAFAALLVAGCAGTPGTGGNQTNQTNISNSTNSTVPPGYEVQDYCQQDSDCVRLNSCCSCGIGAYVNKYNQAPQCPQGSPRCMCAEIPSHGACQDNKCVGVADLPPVSPPPANATPPPGYEVKDYCQQDSDCVRLNSCCDCGAGQYVNIYNQQPACAPGQPRCMCPVSNSEGACISNRCVAVTISQNIGLSFNSSQGYCGNETAPQLSFTQSGISLNGSVGGGSVCRYATAQIAPSDGGYTLNISTRAIPGVDTCINCAGAIPWSANISGLNGSITVYYDGRLVYPPGKGGFCGWATSGACKTSADCVRSGCSGEVCQSASEQPAITSCIYKSCYDAAAAGVSCGCVAGRCQWG